jgi:sRNA-binding carbon storage regulator CsrA
MNKKLSITSKYTSEKITFQVTDDSGKVVQFSQLISQVDGKRVRLNFEAPANVKILREEIIK